MSMKITRLYKIHCLGVAQGTTQAPGFNDTFYTTYEQALEQARNYATKSIKPSPMVIYKAHVLVRASQPPIEVLTIERDGEVVPLR